MATAAAHHPTPLGTSNLRSSSGRQTRTNPTRTSKIAASVLRQNSFASSSHAGGPTTATAQEGASERLQQQQKQQKHGFYPAIQHFTDAVAALPRDYRRHVSLLKEVDAKAFNLEADLQQLLTQCTTYTSSLVGGAAAAAAASRAAKTAAPLPAPQPGQGQNQTRSDESDAAPAAMATTAATATTETSSSTDTRRRQVFHNLRATLMQIMVTMDEKNHVINNANEELTRHLRRFHNIWPHVSNEISEEAMLGSLKHWAYTDINPPKKSTTTTRRDAAAAASAAANNSNAGLLHESDIAHRSESRREAVAAKSKRNPRILETGYTDGSSHITTVTGKKTTAADKRRAVAAAAAAAAAAATDAQDLTGLGIATGPPFRGKKAKVNNSAAAADKAVNAGVLGASGGAMSREPSQQDGGGVGGKKRKAPAATSGGARKRVNANANQDSPKLPQAPLAGTLGKEPYKRSPALGAARPATSRGRQNSLQTHSENNTSNPRGRPPSTSVRNGLTTGSTPEQHGGNAITTAPGKAGNDTKNVGAKDIPASKGTVEEETPTPNGSNSDLPSRGATSMERTTSRQGVATRDLSQSTKPSDSPQPSGPAVASRGRTSKVGTPVIGSVAEAESSSAGTAAENGTSKSKRPARPRVKDHGLHDSLSPKGLPLKRSHKKGGSLASIPSTQTTTIQNQNQHQHQHQQRGIKPEVDNLPADDYSEEPVDDLLEDEKYCYCNGPSYGEMIACDNPKCPGEWFHLECIGLKNAPKSEKWFCEDCKEKAVVGGKRNGNGR